ncbi:Uncharacterised protein [Actinobacillus lignieresii]|uniref:hypothetical protein n=1 Tax=Actinobacillus lignieresii TaxID=720 RepID=UPI000F6FB5E8|nr:hypothetical protein [Actinobacillus lignieresii]VEB27316.1 Uncharacterised protein [Actinobacillus lignieresii]
MLFNPYILILSGSILLLFSAYKIYIETETLRKAEMDLKNERGKLQEEKQNLEKEKSSLRTQLIDAQEECANLKSDISLARKNQVGDWLKGLFKQFKLTTHDRVSIYCVVEDNFHMVHRYSDNPSLCNTAIHQYPLHKGVIYHTWCHNKCYENKCVSYDENEDEYLKYISMTYGYNIDEIKNMKMKSCHYLGLSIKEKGVNIGVIIFESTRVTSLVESSITKIENYCKDYNEYLCGFVQEYILDIDKDNTVRHSLYNSENDKEIYRELVGGQK